MAVLSLPTSTAIYAEGWELKSSILGDLEVPNAGDQQTCAVVFDIDGDGLDDFVVGERTKAPSIVWYKYNAGKWDRFVIEDERLRPEAGGTSCDIDGDGDLDLILGQDSSGNEMWWWENPAPKFAKPWTRRIIKNRDGHKHHDQSAADYDGDGQIELVSWNQKDKRLLLFEIPADVKNSGPWPSSVIHSWSKGRESEGFPSIAMDIDLDGKPDIVGGGSWFKHQGGTRFEIQTIDDSMRFTQCAAGQLIAGGRPEVVFSPGDMDGEAKWYAWDGQRWVGHALRFVVHGHTCEVRDVNDDGHLDIFIAEMGSPGAGNNAKNYVFQGDSKGNFKETVVFGGQGNHEGYVADLDGDGDLDILQKPYNHNSPRVDILLNPVR